ncbi:MAG: RNA polymerase sigma factor [Bacteroidota bacterium]|nr:RNA polymerase sigma factor [Bacteroidota bacterium]
MNIQPALIRDCIDRKRKAEYEMYKLTYSYLMSICIRYTGNVDKAKEVLNLGFLKVLNNLQKYRTEIPFKVWIRKIMVNTLIDEFRKDKTHNYSIQYVEEYIETSDFSDLNEAISRYNLAQIHGFINNLPFASKQVFNLYVVDGFNHREIAEMLKISEGTSKWHLNFARTKLKEQLIMTSISGPL